MVRRLIQIFGLAAIAGAAATGVASASVAVVGGAPIQVQSAPWTVFVFSEFGSYEEDCTGSVIDPSHVVTAAHCVFDTDGSRAQPGSVNVAAGISNFISPSSSDLEQRRSVSSLRVHPGWVSNPATVAVDDVAVLELATPLDLSGPAVKAVALPAAGATFPALASVSIAGYGLQDGKASEASGALESMTAQVFWQGECSSANPAIIELDNGIELCDSSPTSSVCSGDSGSGLITTNGTPTLVGVVSGAPVGCPVGGDSVAVYVGAPEILSFIQGSDQPPTAPRGSSDTSPQLTWTQPLVVGGQLTCATGGWPGPVQVGYSFLDVATGTVLQSGSSPTYRLSSTSAGTTIFCEVAATNSGGTTVAYSPATPLVRLAPRFEIEPPVPLSGKLGQKVTLRVVLHRPPGLSGAIRVCAAPPASVGKGTCTSKHEPSGASGLFAFALTIMIKPNAKLGTAHVKISATEGSSEARTTVVLRVRKR